MDVNDYIRTDSTVVLFYYFITLFYFIFLGKDVFLLIAESFEKYVVGVSTVALLHLYNLIVYGINVMLV